MRPSALDKPSTRCPVLQQVYRGVWQTLGLLSNSPDLHRGDADVVFVHAKAQEEKFVAEGYGGSRYPVMYNDFVVVGPKSDPAGIKGTKDVAAALKTIMAKKATFFSRGDRSGTHSAELRLWKVAGIDIAKQKGPWYKALGQGMGATLNTAAAAGGYRPRSRHRRLLPAE